jgi:hypothetical protein
MSEPFQIQISDTQAIAVLECILIAVRRSENRGPCASLAKEWAGGLARTLFERKVIPQGTADEWRRELLGEGAA